MTTYFLKFADEAEAIAKLAAFRDEEAIYETVPTGETIRFVKLADTLSGNAKTLINPTDEVISEHLADDFTIESDTTSDKTKRVQVGVKGIWLTYKDGANIDVVGTIYKPTGNKIDTEIGKVPEMAPLDGFHVNILADSFDESLAAYQTFPATPSRVFA